MVCQAVCRRRTSTRMKAASKSERVARPIWRSASGVNEIIVDGVATVTSALCVAISGLGAR